MSEIEIKREVGIEEPFFIEGLPGTGLASKIAADHVVDKLDMEFFATVEADGLPDVMIFEEDERDLKEPVRMYVDEESGLVALTSDVLVSAVDVDDFASTVVEWIEGRNAKPLFLSGFPSGAEDKGVYGVTTGEAGKMLEDADIEPPKQRGVVGGPTGALLHNSEKKGIEAACLVVDTDPQFPDPVAARMLIDQGVEPIAGFDIGTDELTERAEKIKEQKQKLAKMLQQAESHEKGQAFPEGMYE
ncbi:MAG: proteasome assembly chaperone family protein [Candidatus Nanohaloarchaea archaeon]